MAREKPISRSARKKINRGTLRSRDSDNAKNLSIGLMDIDGAIMFYFNNVIKPVVQENDESIKVPIMYSNPERWDKIQKNGHLIDNKKQLIIPLIVFKRTSIEKDTSMTVDKLDPKDPKLFYTFQKKYSKENRYDNFAVQQGLHKTRELYTVGVPDYVSVTYDFIVWTSYTEQMNKIIEKIIYSEGSYWGEDGKFKFRTSIDSYTDASEMSVNSERIIKTNFTVTLKGYLIPEEFNNVITTQKHLTPKRLLIGDDVSVNLTNLVGSSDSKNVRVSVNNSGGGGTAGILENPFGIFGGTGVSVGGAGIFDGRTSSTFTFNIGQDVGTDANVDFNSIHIGQNSLNITERPDGKAQVDKDWVVLGDVIANNYIVSSSTTHMTTSFSSGSTAFGDTLNDNHRFTGSMNITGSLILNGITILSVTEADTYARKQFVKKAASITVPSTASFTAVPASAPTGLTTTNEQDFTFFINGQYMEHDALTIKQFGSTFLLLVDTDSIGYDLESDDEIIATGKFNS